MEPYAGGAGVALELLFHGYAEHVHINDIDPAIYSFWISVINHPEQLIELINSTPINIDEWHKWRSVLHGKTTSTIVEKGFATLFMNRTNRSGILKAGVIGGKDQLGTYKLDARFNKNKISKRIEYISKWKGSISVYCSDSLELLNNCKKYLPKKSLIYLDPPYYKKGRDLYRNFYEHRDHLDMSNMIQRKNFSWPWVISYDDTEEIREMYKSSRQKIYKINYTAQRRYAGNEIMFFSNKLVII